MRNKCNNECNNSLILKNKNIFKKIHKNKSISKINFDNNLILIPVTINICLTKEKYKIDFIKYSKYIVDRLNNGFSGNIESKYKNDKYSK